ncbi:MAG: MBL fold metallo-hydrolase [Bacteroidota bacterium]|nr:MBL fold metallo-hydrolase [Bacteroidota bacterium]
MRVTFLGTGTSQGVPVIACKCNVCRSLNEKDKRLRSSIMIEVDDNIFVIDSGPDFRQQMLREKPSKLDALIITHGHKDHIGGMDDIRAFNFILKKPIDVYASIYSQESIRREYSYVFAEVKYPGIPQITFHTIENKTFYINNVRIIPILCLHYKMNVFGYRIGDFTYITDASFVSEIEKDKIRGSKIVVINALRKTPHISHFTLSQSINFLYDINPDKAYITHVSHQMGLHDEINDELPSFIRVAYDGLKIEI